MHPRLLSLTLALLVPSLRAAVFSVTSNADQGAGSLRQAILDANANPGPDVIEFHISAVKFYTITIPTDLPEITEAVLLDGSTQTGYAGLPLVTVRASNRASDSPKRLLRINTSECTLRGLAFNAIYSNDNGVLIEPGNAIEIVGGHGNRIVGCHIGVPANGVVTALVNPVQVHGSGVLISNSFDNVIGGTLPNERNVIGGCGGDGILITGSASTGNRVMGNILGFDRAGLIRVAGGEGGVGIVDAPGNTVGGTAVEQRNLIVPSFSRPGVRITGAGSSNNAVLGNWVGLKSDGTATKETLPTGIQIATNASWNVIGGAAVGAGNVVGGLANGVIILSSSNSVLGNLVGLGPDGSTIQANNNSGIGVVGDGNRIGGPEPGQRNIASGNRGGGISVTGKRNVVQGNWVGLDITGRLPRPNGGGFINGGIQLGPPATDNWIGGAGPRRGNVVCANLAAGIALVGASVSNNVIQGNLIGLDITGTNVLGNLGNGISLLGARYNSIGGPEEPLPTARRGARLSDGPADALALAHGNGISGNQGYAVELAGSLGTTIGDSANDNLIDHVEAGVHAPPGTDGETYNFLVPSSPAELQTAQNAKGGVRISYGDRNSFGNRGPNFVNSGPVPPFVVTGGTGNRIFVPEFVTTSALVIDLNFDGPTENHDPALFPPGPNHLQNKPVITSAANTDGVVTGTLEFAGTADVEYEMEVFLVLKDANGNDLRGSIEPRDIG
jgi:hypothetical protein